jgi:hypothetical protein
MHALDIDNEIAIQFAYFVAEVKGYPNNPRGLQQLHAAAPNPFGGRP